MAGKNPWTSKLIMSQFLFLFVSTVSKVKTLLSTWSLLTRCSPAYIQLFLLWSLSFANKVDVLPLKFDISVLPSYNVCRVVLLVVFQQTWKSQCKKPALFLGRFDIPTCLGSRKRAHRSLCLRRSFQLFRVRFLNYYLFTGCVLFVFHVFLYCCDSFWIFFLALVFPAGDKRVTVASFLYRDLGDLLPKRATGAKK